MEIDYDYLRTGTAIGFRASYELCSNFLFFFAVLLLNVKLLYSFAGSSVVGLKVERDMKLPFSDRQLQIHDRGDGGWSKI